MTLSCEPVDSALVDRMAALSTRECPVTMYRFRRRTGPRRSFLGVQPGCADSDERQRIRSTFPHNTNIH